jgi:hypothetical protein
MDLTDRTDRTDLADLADCLDLFQSRPEHAQAFLPADQVAAALGVLGSDAPWTVGYYPVIEGAVPRTADHAKPSEGALVSGGTTKFGADMDCVVDESIRRVRAGTPVTVTHVAYVPAHARATDAAEVHIGADGPVTAFTRDGYRGPAVLEDDVLTLPHVVAGSEERRAADALVLPEKSSDPHVAIMKERPTSVKVADGADPRDAYDVLKPFAVDVLRSVSNGVDLGSDLASLDARLATIGRRIFGRSSGPQESDAVKYLIQRIAARAKHDEDSPSVEPFPEYKNAGSKGIAYSGPPKAIPKDDLQRLTKHNAGATDATEAAPRSPDDWKAVVASRKPARLETREEYPAVNDNVVRIAPLQTDDDPHVRNMHAVDTSVVDIADGIPAYDSPLDDQEKIGAEGTVRKAYSKVASVCSMVIDRDLVDASVAGVVHRWQARVPRGPRLDMLKASFAEVGEDAALIAALDTMSAESMAANPQKLIADVAGCCAVDCAITTVRTFRPALARVSSPKDFHLSVAGLVKYAAILLDKAGMVKGVADTIKAGEVAATKLPPNTDKILETLGRSKTGSSASHAHRLDPALARSGCTAGLGPGEFPAYASADVEDATDATEVAFTSHVKVARAPVSEAAPSVDTKSTAKLGKLPGSLKSIVYGGTEDQQSALLVGACPGFVALLRTKLPSDSQKAYEQYMTAKDAADFAAKLAKLKAKHAKRIDLLKMPAGRTECLVEFVRRLSDVDASAIDLFDLYVAAFARPVKAGEISSDVGEIAPDDDADDNEDDADEEDTAYDELVYDSDGDGDS